MEAPAEQDSPALVDAVADRLEPYPVDMEWLRRVVGAYARHPRPLAPLPKALAAALGLRRYVEPSGEGVVAVLAASLHAATEERRSGRGTARIGLQKAIALADAIAAGLPDAVAIAALGDVAPVTSARRDGRSVKVDASVGWLGITATFRGAGGDGAWVLGWDLDEPSKAIARGLHALAPPGRGTGLFAPADRAVRAAIRDFLDCERPASLLVQGFDEKRKAHYARTFGSIDPDGYRLEAVKAAGDARADADGVHAIELVRLPEPGMRAGIP